VLVTSGAAGARLTGAGFGGCVVALTQRNHADDVLAKATLRYRAATGIEPTGFVARAVDGARVSR
jgi:galactokinase